MKKQIAVYFAASFLFFVLLLWLALQERQVYIDKYNQGVEYFERGAYQEAMEVFNAIRNWNGRVDISPEDYYDMAVEKLINDNPNTVVCPNCGMAVRLDGGAS